MRKKEEEGGYQKLLSDLSADLRGRGRCRKLTGGGTRN